MSNIKVYVEWENPVVYSGEEVKCTISVKNEAEGPVIINSSNPVAHSRRFMNGGQENPPVVDENEEKLRSQHGSHLAQSANEGERSERRRSQEYLVTTTPKADRSSSSRPSPSSNSAKHARSVSIVSLGASPNNTSQQLQGRVGALQLPTIPKSRRHSRATSFQGTGSGSYSHHHHKLNSPASTKLLGNSFSRAEAATSARTLGPDRTPTPQDISRRRIEAILLDDVQDSNQGSSDAGNIRSTEDGSKSAHVHPTTNLSQNGEILRTITPLAPIDTPRTSTDLNSPSNDSTETLVSEYFGASMSHSKPRLPYRRQSSHLGETAGGGRSPVSLIIGYACLTGSFVLEQSLVNTSLFEEVKRKGTIGWQGSGGVVGIQPKKRDNSLLGNIGWHKFGESLGGLLKPTEPSTLRTIKSMVENNAIPIISTPQTILFVDLRLKPGEAKTFTYRYLLPLGIPPSHKGRAIKISYGLIVGIQKQQVNLQQQSIQHVEVPIRVLPGVEADGNVVKHNLMCPHVQTKTTDMTGKFGDQSRHGVKPVSRTKDSLAAYDPSDLVSYVQDLLKPTQDPSQGLLSPTEPTTSFPPEAGKAHFCTEDIINGILTRGFTWPKIGPSRYQIKRDGEHVAVLLLTRPSYRIGESIPIVVDFRKAETPCHSLRISLESLELIDPAVALRSELSTQRMTRKVHASRSEYASYGSRISFSLTIPINGTPNFATSNIELIWQLRIEFSIMKGSIRDMTYSQFMEEIVKDDRGRILAAKDKARCDSLEVNIPLRVFGTRGCLNDQIAEPTRLLA